MKKLFLFSVVMFLFAATSIFAQMRNDGKPNFEGRKWSGLNLTADQKSKIEKIHGDHFKSVSDLKSEIKKYRTEIKDELSKKDLDKNKIKNLANKIITSQAKLKESAIDNWFASYDVLDDTQKEKFKNNFPRFMDDNKQKHDGKRKHMRKNSDGKGTRSNQSVN